MPDLVTRATVAIEEKESVTAGRIRYRMDPPPYPDGGSTDSSIAKRWINRSPSQKKHRDDHGGEGESQRAGKAFEYRLCDGPARHEGTAEVEPRQPAEILRVLKDDRPVQAELLSYVVEGLIVVALAYEREDGIPGHDVHEQEGHGDDAEENRHEEENPFRREFQHVRHPVQNDTSRKRCPLNITGIR